MTQIKPDLAEMTENTCPDHSIFASVLHLLAGLPTLEAGHWKSIIAWQHSTQAGTFTAKLLFYPSGEVVRVGSV
jgi:hypothetical protein